MSICKLNTQLDRLKGDWKEVCHIKNELQMEIVAQETREKGKGNGNGKTTQ